MFSCGVTDSKFQAFMNSQIEALNDDKLAQKFCEALALKFVSAVVEPGDVTTPVDTGRAKAGWARALEELGGTFHEEGRDPKAISDGKKRGGLRYRTGKRKGDMGYVAITNNVKYIVFLEYGYSDQAPAGFIRITLEDLRGEYVGEARAMVHDMMVASNASARAAAVKWKGAAPS